MKAIFWVALFWSTALPAQSGTLNVYSRPEECWVRIDSVLVGKTPLHELELPAGTHQVQVSPPQNGIWNLQEQVFTVDIQTGTPAEVHAVFSSPVFINSIPYGAQLLSDSTLFGKTPLYIPFEENRGKAFRLEKQGYKPYEFRLTAPTSILAELEKSGGFVEEKAHPRLLGLIPRQRLKSKFALLAATVVTHWASFYFKNAADSNFEKYQASSDPALTRKYWDNTQKYDRLSDISLGVSYASLAGLIYMVIWK